MSRRKTSSLVAIAFALALVAACRSREDRAPGRPDGSEATPRAPTSSSAAATEPAPALSSTPEDPARRSIPELQRILLDAHLFEALTPADGKEYTISPDDRMALLELKDGLLSSVDRNLESMVKSPLARDTLQKTFVAEGVRWAEKEWKDGAINGTLAPAPLHEDRWLVTLCILISPGSDCLAAVYERREGTTRRAMVFRNDRYTSVEGAVHALHWVISPPDERDRFYLLEAHTYPWPSSNWRDFSYSALTPGKNPNSPEPGAQDSGFAYWVDGFDLKAVADGFSVAFSGKGDDPAKLKKTVTHRWNRTATGFHRQHAAASSRPNAN